MDDSQRQNICAYRRAMEIKHKRDLLRIISYSGYKPHIGYIDWDRVDDVWQPVGKYIKYPKNSNAQRYWKRHSNKIIRRRNEIYRGNHYRKCFDYWWTLY